MSSKKVYFTSLGCDKNLADSQKTLKLLSLRGYAPTPDIAEADIAVVNTCCFIRDALQESIDTLIELSELKRLYGFKLIVMGCMGERYPEEIKKEFPEADLVLGIAKVSDTTERILSVPNHYAYLKIADGCDKNCTYCAIPLMRGSYRSAPLEALKAEAKQLLDDGVKELILVAQETTLYGVDIYGEKYLPRLLRELDSLEAPGWIRLMYCYPEEIDEKLINALCQLKKVVKYLDIPIQSASDHILRRMGRKTRRKEIEELILRLREEIPGIALRTTLISGFPGETLKDHEQTLDFVERMRFERLGVFCYSREEGTKAYNYSHRVSEREKEKRRAEIMSLQQGISKENNRLLTGKCLELIVDGRIEEGVYIGRSYMDAPDIDSFVYFDSDSPLMSGDFVRVRVLGSNEYDLIAKRV